MCYDIESSIARLEATTADLVEAMRELRAHFRTILGLQLSTLGGLFTFGLAIAIKFCGGSQ